MSVTTKIIGLASTAITFAGMAFGQANLTCAPSTPNAISPAIPIELRSEGAAELVSDELITCAAAPAGSTSGQVTATLSGTGLQGITSKVVTPSTGVTEATLAVTGAATSYYQGTVSGNTITFGTAASPVNFPTVPFTIQISNVRVNVTGQWPNNLQPVTETVQLVAQGNGLAAVTNIAAQIVGNVRNSLSVTGTGAAVIAPGSNTAGTAASVNNFLVCNTGGTAFNVTIGALFAGAFKTKSQQVTGSATPALVPTVAGIPGAEDGSLTASVANGLVAGTGVANFGTRFKLVFANIPGNATISVPTVVTNGAFQITLVDGAAVDAFSAAASGTLSASNGIATAIYEVTTTDVTATGSFTVPATVSYTANSVTPTTTPISVAVSYAPSSELSVANGGALPSTLPTIPYFANTATPLNGSTFTACQTTLLFPFVTNVAGFETGLSISNTGADLLNVSGSSPASSVTGQSGACHLTFFGTGTTATNPPEFTTDSVDPGTTWVGTLTSVTGGASGNVPPAYMIAVCDFLYAHGFSYISYNIGQGSGMAMGYLALEVPTRGGASSGSPENLNN
jgi:hypothetical protein